MKISAYATLDGKHVADHFTFSESHVHTDTLLRIGKGLLFDMNVDKEAEPDWSIWVDGSAIVKSGAHGAIDVSDADADWSFGGTVKYTPPDRG
jgi:hypothetical protein